MNGYRGSINGILNRQNARIDQQNKSMPYHYMTGLINKINGQIKSTK
jgi:hypothetical protein